MKRLILFFFCIPYLCTSQNNDCATAQVVCGDGQIGFNPQGPGVNDFAFPGNDPGCLFFGENQSAWYYFEIHPGAPANQVLGFDLIPNAGIGQDYDFAIFGPTVDCENLGSPTRCSYAIGSCFYCPAIGLGNGATDFSEDPLGDGYVMNLTVQPGEGYFLLIDNFSSNSTGFLLRWNGSAAPWLDCSANPPCGLSANAGTDINACEGDGPFSIFGSSSASGSETYSWSGSGSSLLNNSFSQNPTLTLPPNFSGSLSLTLTVNDNGCSEDDDIALTINPLPFVSINQVGPFCGSAAPVLLFANPGGGTWSSNASGGIFNPSFVGTGVHTVIYSYTDANGCTNSTSIDITVSDGPQVSINPDPATFCEEDGFIVLTANGFGGGGNYAYSWDTPTGQMNGANINGLNEGFYTVTITDGIGCENISSLFVTQNATPVINIIDPGTVCESESFVGMEAFPIGGVWSGNGIFPDGSVFPTNLGNGIYSLTYTYTDAFGCVGSDVFDLEIVTAPTAMASNSGPVCGGMQIELYGDALSAFPVTYLWNGPNGYSSTEQNPTNATEEGEYLLQVSTAFNCLSEVVSTMVVFTPSPDIQASNGGPYCPGQGIELFSNTTNSGTTISYLWTGPNGYSSIQQNPVDATEPGDYSVQLTVDGCQSIVQNTAVIINQITSPTISGNTVFCEGLSTNLDAGPGYSSYSWSNGNNSQTTTISLAGNYTVTVTDADGCSSEANIVVTENVSPSPTINGTDTFCFGGSSNLDAGAGFTTYDWSTGGSGQSITVNAGGTYTVTVTNASGCTGESDMTVTENNLLTPVIAGNLAYCNNENTLLDAGAGFTTYSWTGGDTGQTLQVNSPGTYSVTVSDASSCTGEASVTISENPLPTLNIDGAATLCEGTTTMLTVSSSFASYDWSNNSSGQSLTVSTSGTYSVTVTDSNGCTNEASVSVSVNPLPNLVLTGATTFCSGTNTTIDAGSGYSNYIWSNGDTDQTIVVTQGGAYSVTVTDANGCTAEDQVDVLENNTLSPQISGTLSFCEGENSLLDAGSGYSSYQWSTGSTNQTLSVTATGTYSVIVTDASGCTGETSVSVSENPLPSFSITGATTFCSGTSTTIEAGSGYSSYIWSNDDTDQTIVVTQGGAYSVTVTDANGCTAEDQVDVLENNTLSPQISGTLSFCEGENGLLDAGSGYSSYQWSTGSTNQTLSVTATGTYSVIVTDASGCTGETSVSVSENPLPSFSITGATTFCSGTSTTIEAGSGYSSYIWSNGDTDQTIVVTQGGAYSVTITDANGCTAEDQVDVLENNTLSPQISGTLSFCEGENSLLDAGSGYSSYQWSTGSTNQTLSVTATGTYSVIVTDASGCTGETSVSVSENPLPSFSITGATTFCSGTSTTIEAGSGYSSYIWSNGDTDQTIVVTQGGAYSVTVTDANGCTAEDQVDVLENNTLSPQISGTLSFCEGENGLLDAGSGYSSYQWSTGSTNQTLSVTATGTYSVIVTDASGCTGETSVSVSESPLPVVNIQGTASICEGETTELSTDGFYVAYEWSNNNTDQNIIIGVPGTYSVTITDGNGCTNETSIEVIENSNPEPVILGLTSFCTGSNLILELDNNYSTYEWSNGSNGETLELSSSGTYSVTVSNASGCTGEAEWTVTENNSLEPIITGVLSFCAGEYTTLTAPSNLTYFWSNNMTTQSITVSTPGDYTLLVTDNTGCTGTAVVDVVENITPLPTITGLTTFCTGYSTILDAGNGYSTFLWSDGSTSQTLEVTSANNYAVTVTNNNGCTGEAQLLVAESTSLNPVILGNLQLCEGEVSTLDAGPGYVTYLWSTSETTSTISTSQSGTYAVTVSDVSGCTGEETVLITVNTNPAVVISGVTNICEDENSLLDAGEGYASYLWSDGSEDQTLMVSSSGNYRITVSDNNGCTSESSLNVVQNPAPMINVTGPSSFCSGNSATLSVPGIYNNYIWSTGETTPSITLITGATVSVTVTDANGCIGEASSIVTENTELAPVILGDLVFCEGESTLLDAEANWTTYQWSNGATTPTITVSDEGNYGIVVTDVEGCSGSATITVTVNQNPNPVIAGSTTFCTGNSTTLDVGNYTSRIWSTGSTSQSIVTNQPGNYSVVVTDVNGCIGEATVVVEESTSLSPVIAGVPAFCENESTILDAGAGFASYIWSGGSANQTLEVTTAGDYSVTVSDVSGCSGEASITVNSVLPPETELQSNLEICNTELSGSTLNLYDFIIAGDMNGSWEDLDDSGAFGLLSDLNFDGVSAGDYNF